MFTLLRTNTSFSQGTFSRLSFAKVKYVCFLEGNLPRILPVRDILGTGILDLPSLKWSARPTGWGVDFQHVWQGLVEFEAF